MLINWDFTKFFVDSTSNLNVIDFVSWFLALKSQVMMLKFFFKYFFRRQIYSIFNLFNIKNTWTLGILNRPDISIVTIVWFILGTCKINMIVSCKSYNKSCAWRLFNNVASKIFLPGNTWSNVEKDLLAPIVLAR